MNEVFKLCGWEGPAYLQATNAVAEQVPVINTPTGLYLEDGVLTDALTPRGCGPDPGLREPAVFLAQAL